MKIARNTIINTIIIRLLPFTLFFCTGLASWAAGDLEEQYYIVLDNNESYIFRQLEKNFYDYARKNDVDMRVFGLSENSYSSKFNILLSGANNKNPVLIFSSYEPKMIKNLETIYYNNGEFSTLGYMGSLLIIDEPSNSLDDDLTYDIPWQVISINTNYLAQEILLALGQNPQHIGDKDTHTQKNPDIPSIHSPNRSFPVNAQQTLLWVIDGFSRNDHTINKALLKKIIANNSNPNLIIQKMYTNTKLDPKSALVDSYVVEGLISPKDTSIKEIPENSNVLNSLANPTKSARMYKIMDTYLKNNRVENISVVYVNNTYEGILIQKAFAMHNLPQPLIIAWGLSPEAKTALQDGSMLLAFDYNYKKYVATIMKEAMKLYDSVAKNSITDAMLDREEPYPKFTKKTEIQFSVSAYRKEDM